MNEIALAVQAMSACDRLEQGIKDGDEGSVAVVREMVSRWAGRDFKEVHGSFAVAFRLLMKRCSEGGPEDMALAMMAIRCLTEHELSRAFGNDVEGEITDT